jgi:hypothetical protein
MMDRATDPLRWVAINWKTVGQHVLAQLPVPEQSLFIRWLAQEDARLDLYSESPGHALRLWQDSPERYQIR